MAPGEEVVLIYGPIHVITPLITYPSLVNWFRYDKKPLVGKNRQIKTNLAGRIGFDLFRINHITGFLLSGHGTWRGSCPRLWSNPYLGHTENGPFLCIAFDCMQGWSLDNYICHKRLAARHEWLRKALRFGIRSIGFEASNKCNLRETRLHFDRFLLGPKRGG